MDEGEKEAALHAALMLDDSIDFDIPNKVTESSHISITDRDRYLIADTPKCLVHDIVASLGKDPRLNILIPFNSIQRRRFPGINSFY